VSGESSWSDIAGWWVAEVDDDPAYRQVVLPLLLDVLEPPGRGSATSTPAAGRVG
jgi:hypothetical protein